MRVAALLSGGKDSVAAARRAQLMGHHLTHLVTLHPQNPHSYMFHSSNTQLAALQAQAWGITHIQATTPGRKEEELQDLERVLDPLPIEGVVTGAIASNYQATRVNAVCGKLGLQALHPLWGIDPQTHLEWLTEHQVHTIFTAVAAHGLDQTWLGRPLDNAAIERLKALNAQYGVHLCGEGGEYETLVLDAPWFSQRIQVEKAQKHWDGNSGVYHITLAHLAPK